MTPTSELETIKAIFLASLPEDKVAEFALRPQVDVFAHELDAYYVRVIQAVFGQMLDEWPLDWWQAFKQRFFPGWLKRLSPVKRRDVMAFYPKLLHGEEIHIGFRPTNRDN